MATWSVIRSDTKKQFWEFNEAYDITTLYKSHIFIHILVCLTYMSNMFEKMPLHIKSQFSINLNVTMLVHEFGDYLYNN